MFMPKKKKITPQSNLSPSQSNWGKAFDEKYMS